MAKLSGGKFSWAGRFPDGRTVFYEGGDQDGFLTSPRPEGRGEVKFRRATLGDRAVTWNDGVPTS